jgi:hypothetical protein
VKGELLRDQALYGRCDEALVRSIVPGTASEEAACNRAVNIVAELVRAVDLVVPGRAQQEK